MKCKVCGKEITSGELCFECHFWQNMLEEDSKRPPHTVCMIDGSHYVIVPDDNNSKFLGFGGAEFQIEFNDGFKVVTHNLWHQGEPSSDWIDKFPNNARFESNLKWVEIRGNQYLV